tara:strand:- start:1585 stop:1719 length:135 start_codon:yes stop_codon:yes gene_type:complete
MSNIDSVVVVTGGVFSGVVFTGLLTKGGVKKLFKSYNGDLGIGD